MRPLPPAIAAAVPTVLRWCARLGGPAVDAEDAAQDVLEVAVRRYPSLRDATALEAWLFGITRRVLAKHRRRAWWTRWAGNISAERPADTPGPEGLAGRRERARQLQHWLEQLPQAQREVVVLCALEERSRSEAAHLLGIPEGTVKSRYRLAMARLRQLAGAGLPEGRPA